MKKGILSNTRNRIGQQQQIEHTVKGKNKQTYGTEYENSKIQVHVTAKYNKNKRIEQTRRKIANR